MRQQISNKKLPSILGITIIIFGIVLTTFLVQRTNILQGDASASENPKNIKITNNSDDSFSIIYMTDKSVIGEINLGENPNNLSQKFLDDKDNSSNEINTYSSHSITTENLKPETEYYYTIKSGNKTITDNGKPFSIKTGPKIENSSNNKLLIQGKVVNSDGTPVNDGIALIKIAGSNQISTIVNDGDFLLSTEKLLTEKLDNFMEINEKSIIDIEIISGEQFSLVRISGNQKSPLPTITLSNNYDFIQTLPTPTITSPSRNIKFPGFKSKIKTIRNSPSITSSPTKAP